MGNSGRNRHQASSFVALGILVALFGSAFPGCGEDEHGGTEGEAGSGDTDRPTGGSPTLPGETGGAAGERTSGAGGTSGASGAGTAGGGAATGDGGTSGSGGDFSMGGAVPSPGCTDPDEEGGLGQGGSGGAADETGIVLEFYATGPVATIGNPATLSSWGSWDTRCFAFEASCVFEELPDGSQLTDADIERVSDAEWRIYPDAPGTYRFRLTLTTADGRSKSGELELQVRGLSIPYVRVQSEDGVITGSARVVSDDGFSDEPVGGEFMQHASSEEAWIAEEFEADVAARTAAAYDHPTSQLWTLAYPTNLYRGWRTLGLITSNGLGPVTETSLEEAEAARFPRDGSTVVYLGRVDSTADAPFRVGTVEADGYRRRLIREGVRLPERSIPPFWYGRGEQAWLEAGREPDIELELWVGSYISETIPADARVVLSCEADSNHFTVLRQLESTERDGLLALVATSGFDAAHAIYRLTADENGNFSCDPDSPLNHRVYGSPSDAEPVLEIHADQSQHVLFVQQLPDGRNTRILRTSYQQEVEPAVVVDLAGRNNGIHLYSYPPLLLWTRTLYEPGPGITRPITSELWRARYYDGFNPTRIVAHESTPERAVLITSGLNAGIRIPTDLGAAGATGAGGSGQ
jgi:hypothetical protein